MNDLNSLQDKLKQNLLKKKFLLVLDDVWNENYSAWLTLRPPFDAGESGSKILVTTRSSGVSSIMRTFSDYLLKCLSEEDSLRMLAHQALGREDFTRHPDLKEIGMEILKKCGGLPLATITMGGLLRTKENRDAWKDILESDIWDLPPGKSDIVLALWLSYYYLPSHLKQCFAYCSLLPKDYEFNEEEIVLSWMAEGFLQAANTKRRIEDLGSKYFHELPSSLEEKSFLEWKDMRKWKRPSQTRHCSHIMDEYEEIKKFETFFQAKSLRTFLPIQMMRYPRHFLSNNVLRDLLSRLKCLRVLSLKRNYITEIPYSIGNLRHLRSLNFSYTWIKGQLSISELHNVNEAQDAREANLSSKPDLDDLELKWSEVFDEDLRKKEVETEVLKLLQPHQQLKALAIMYYAGLAFPNWIEDPSFKNLQSLKLARCPNCKLLPAVGKLRLLKDLSIRGMSGITSICNELYGENFPNAFPSLEILQFDEMAE
ncbi:hypothetical protein PTKIN_Ptkin16aG0013900 [Pterospermum kingtungense]